MTARGMTNSDKLGNRLKVLRAERDLTQAELARRVGVTRKTINTVENRVFVPSTVLALELSRELGVTVEEIFHLVGDDEPGALPPSGSATAHHDDQTETENTDRSEGA